MTNWYRFLGATLFTTVLFVVAPISAQDVVKVSPETHKVLLDNEHVRVLDVHAKPGEKVGMHSHPASTLYYLTHGRLKITYPDGRTEERTVKAGTAVWSDAVTHAVAMKKSLAPAVIAIVLGRRRLRRFSQDVWGAEVQRHQLRSF